MTPQKETKREPRKQTHKHRWSGYLPGGIKICLIGPCGAMKYASGQIVIMRDGRKAVKP